MTVNTVFTGLKRPLHRTDVHTPAVDATPTADRRARLRGSPSTPRIEEGSHPLASPYVSSYTLLPYLYTIYKSDISVGRGRFSVVRIIRRFRRTSITTHDGWANRDRHRSDAVVRTAPEHTRLTLLAAVPFNSTRGRSCPYNGSMGDAFSWLDPETSAA